MNVFVLSTGRCGTTTFARACAHMRNYTVGHETRARRPGPERLGYPPDHIEVDNRLAWMLGRLDAAFGDKAFYVHLLRDAEAVVESFDRRWHFAEGIGRAYRAGVLIGTDAPPRDCLYDMIETINENIRCFLKDKSRRIEVRLENISSDFRLFWERIGAAGDLNAALAEWSTAHNASPPPAPPRRPKSAKARLREALGVRL
jgi:hypothetical protein